MYYHKICVICNKEFITTRGKQITCSNECRDRYNRPKAYVKKVCINCGKEFIPVYNPQSSYCSKICKNEYINSMAKNNYKKKKYTCFICGKEINSRSLLCSSECRKKLYLLNDKKTNDYLTISNKKYERLKYKNKIISTKNIGDITEKIRHEVLRRDGFECYICGTKTDLHLHHIIPRSEGGLHTINNLVTLCSHCHHFIESGNVNTAVKNCVKRTLENIKNGHAEILP